MSTALDFDYEEIKRYIEGCSPESVIMIGCDSVRKESHGSAWATYATVICIRRASGKGKDVMYHGCKVFGARVRMRDYGKVVKSGKLANLKTRLLQEVTFALEAFAGISDVIEDRPFEIHLDINSRPDAESNIAMSEAKGYVLGVTGREPEFKPTALAASFAADYHAHGLLN